MNNSQEMLRELISKQIHLNDPISILKLHSFLINASDLIWDQIHLSIG